MSVLREKVLETQQKDNLLGKDSAGHLLFLLSIPFSFGKNKHLH
jgi:hypothetical protein